MGISEDELEAIRETIGGIVAARHGEDWETRLRALPEAAQRGVASAWLGQLTGWRDGCPPEGAIDTPGAAPPVAPPPGPRGR